MDIEKYNEECPTIFIMLSGRTNESSTKRYILWSNYSSHSNAGELESFMKAIYPKRITYHSQPDILDSRKYRAYLTQNYTEEGKEIAISYLSPQSEKDKIKKPLKEYKNCIINRFDDSVKKKLNKREFYKQNPFMEKKRKRFSKTGAKLVRDKPILSLSDDEEEEYKL